MDYNATAPLRPEAARAAADAARAGFGNPSSVHYAGRAAKKILDDSRDRIAETMGARPGEVFFTGGGTEGANLAVRGVAAARGGGHVIVSSVEHPAVLEACRSLGAGFDVTEMPVDSCGRVDPQRVFETIRDDTILISVMWVNNETGVVQPIRAIGEIARERGVVFHTDAVQAFGRIPVDVSAAPVDILTVSGHKFCAPKGVGALYRRRGIELAPAVHGGGQERGLRSGTENVPAVAAMAEAAELARAESAAESARLARLRDALEAGIGARIGDTSVNGAGAERVANTTNVCFRGADGEAVLIALDEHRIAASSASACAATHGGPSHVLLAMGLSRVRADQSLRFSLGLSSETRDVDRCLEVLPGIVERLRAVGKQ